MITSRAALGSLRLVAQDVGLSRRKQGFDSPRERHLINHRSRRNGRRLRQIERVQQPNRFGRGRTSADIQWRRTGIFSGICNEVDQTSNGGYHQLRLFDVHMMPGAAGDDSISGGADNDLAFGNEGSDTIFGDEGNDELYGDEGDDLINGGLGHDLLHGGDGADEMYGAEGHDLLYGADGDDAIEGGDGNDYLLGGFGADDLIGGAGNDTLDGTFTAGDSEFGPYDEDTGDTLSGGDGNDHLFIGANDVAFGGADADIFETGTFIETDADAGIVTDFNPVEDVIQVSVDLQATPNPNITVVDFDDGTGANIVVDGTVVLRVSGAQGLDPNSIIIRDMRLDDLAETA